MTMITPSYLGETIEYSSLHACRSTLEDPTYRNYETNESSRNNWFVGVVALGEGWHNNHHHDPAAASVWHRWWEFDLTYCVILVLKRLGLATKVVEPKRVRHARRS